MANTPEHTRAKDYISEHLANERTFLAWLRTSIGIMAFGFVVERFAIFTKQISLLLTQGSMPTPLPQHLYSASTLTIGQVIVGFGALLCLFSFFQFKHLQKQINLDCYRPSLALSLFVTLAVSLMGILLIVYLSYTL